MRRAPRRVGPQQDALDPTTKKGLIAAGVLAVIAGVVWVVVSNKKAEEAARLKAYEDRLDKFLADLNALDMKKLEDMKRGLELIEKNEKEVWKKTRIDSEVTNKRSRFTGAIDEINRIGDFHATFNAARAVVEGAATQTSEALAETRQKLVEIEALSGTIDPAYPDKIKAWIASIDNILVTKIRDEARAFAAMSSTTPRQGIAKYAAAEDFVFNAVVSAKKAKKPEEAAYTEVYKGLLQEADEYYTKVMTKEFIETIPWKDLLAGDMESKWSKVTNVPGFSCRVSNGILTISPPDTGSKLQGSAGILDQPNDNLRSFLLDMEFAVEGVATMFLHVTPPPGYPDNRQSETFDLQSGDGGVRANEKYTLQALFVGSNLKIWFPENDEMQSYEPSPSWVKRRRGGIAFLIPEKTRLRITRMRIKELR